jgi:putative salt-induced outer membrane protein YdiY
VENAGAGSLGSVGESSPPVPPPPHASINAAIAAATPNMEINRLTMRKSLLRRRAACISTVSMRLVRPAILALFACFVCSAVAAQTPPPEPPPRWDVQVGAAFVGTSGNTDTSTLGADFSMHRRWPVWQIEATASAVRASDRDVRTAERYIGAFRGQRELTTIISVTAGEKLERDRLAGLNLRSISDVGLGYALRRAPGWTLDAISAFAWNHEDPVVGPGGGDPIGVLQLLSKIPFSASADSTQRFTFYPNFDRAAAYRSEAEVTAQAAMTERLALKLGYLWRRSNEPVPGFVENDNMMTASVVVRWKAATPAP